MKVNALVAFIIVSSALRAEPSLIVVDKGIELAGPFDVPDIRQPPTSSAEATFLSESLSRAPWYLNEMVVNINGTEGAFSNNGLVNSDFFTASVIRSGAELLLWWDITNTGYAVSYISVNFDNNFYHVYLVNDAPTSGTSITVTGNRRDRISHIRMFGYHVPETGMTGSMLTLGLATISCVGSGGDETGETITECAAHKCRRLQLSHYSIRSSMPAGRNHTAAGTNGQKFFIFGGRTSGNTVSIASTTFKFTTPRPARGSGAANRARQFLSCRRREAAWVRRRIMAMNSTSWEERRLRPDLARSRVTSMTE